MIARAHLLILAGLVLATPVHARHFTVTLENGSTLETRYEPVEAEWDPGVTMLLSDQGNWIALKTTLIAHVESRDEESGFGYQLDTTPRFLGWILVEVDDEEDEDAAPRYEVPERRERDDSIQPFITIPGINPIDTRGGIPLDGFVDGYFDFYPFGE